MLTVSPNEPADDVLLHWSHSPFGGSCIPIRIACSSPQWDCPDPPQWFHNMHYMHAESMTTITGAGSVVGQRWSCCIGAVHVYTLVYIHSQAGGA